MRFVFSFSVTVGLVVLASNEKVIFNTIWMVGSLSALAQACISQILGIQCKT